MAAFVAKYDSDGDGRIDEHDLAASMVNEEKLPSHHTNADRYDSFPDTGMRLLPFRPFLSNGAKIDFVYLISTMPVRHSGDLPALVIKFTQSQETRRATFFN